MLNALAPSPSQPPRVAPYGLVSLWDMLEIDGRAFNDAIEVLGALRALVVTLTTTNPKDYPSGTSVVPDVRNQTRNELKALTEACNALGAKVTIMTIQDFNVRLDGEQCTYDHFKNAITEIQNNFRRELSLAKLLALDPEKVRMFDTAPKLFGDEVCVKFPSAVYEIGEAGKCLSLARDTASVFHRMRTMEVGIRATARCLSIPDPTKPAERNWGAILRSLSDAVKAKKGTWKGNDAEFFEGLHLSLDKVRNVWRNSTMHVESKYNAEEARDIFDAVRAFMRRLASRLDENGQPLA